VIYTDIGRDGTQEGPELDGTRAVARAAGVPVIVMNYGYTPIPPDELGGDAVTGDFRDVPALVERLLAEGLAG
jgi:hypothetical protein